MKEIVMKEQVLAFQKPWWGLRNFIFKSSVKDKYENMRGILGIVVIM